MAVRKSSDKPKEPINSLNIAEFNRGQASRLIRNVAEKDKAALILKNGKPLAVLISHDCYLRLYREGIDVNEH